MTNRIIPTKTASSWVWEKGHENPNDAWDESTKESLWLRVFDSNGEPMKHINLQGDNGDYFIGYHSFKSCGDSLTSRIRNAGLLGFGSVHLYSLVGDNFIPSLSLTYKQIAVVNQINGYLEEQA
tara:strand:+ start:123 stop:494 length:372 start_codon:yes stop_codon:yes gene_type:complete